MRVCVCEIDCMYKSIRVSPLRLRAFVCVCMSVSWFLHQNIIELAVPPPPIYIKAATMAVAYAYLSDAANGRSAATG